MKSEPLLMKCNTAGIADYCKKHLRQPGIINKVRDRRSAALSKNFQRLHRRVSHLAAPFAERF
eukprot:1529969-Pleurochrysis_carterae.AAC.1